MDDLENRNIVINPGQNTNNEKSGNSNYGNNRIVVEDMFDSKNKNQNNQNNNNGNTNNLMNFMQNPSEAIAKGVMDQATENISKSWYERFKCCNLE